MEKVTLKPIYHRGRECIGIYFNDIVSLNSAVRKITGSRWSKTNSCWYVTLVKENYDAIILMFDGLATTDNTELKVYLNEKKKTTAATITTIIEIPTKKLPVIKSKKTPDEGITKFVKPTTITKMPRVSTVNEHVLPTMRQQLILKAYSPSTIKTYLNEIGQLLQALVEISADSLTQPLMKRYLVLLL